jgi:hypothetical protein
VLQRTSAIVWILLAQTDARASITRSSPIF